MRENEKDFMVICVNENKQRVELSVRGVFPDVNEIADELVQLTSLSEQYDTIAVTINSPGGCVESLSDILSIVRKFDTIITIGGGQICSAGFLLWAAGHVRVIKEYTTIMAHRESYGYTGKTNQHMDVSKHWENVGNRLLVDFLGGILTTEELEKSKYTEVFFTDQDMIERNAAITWKQFIERDSMMLDFTTVMHFGGNDYAVRNDNTVVDSAGNVYKISDLVYNSNIEQDTEIDGLIDLDVDFDEVVTTQKQ